jgi:hypothetical protein
MIERSLMNIRCCLFCTNPLTEPAGGQVIPQWLIDYLGVRDEDLFQGIAQAQDGALLKQRTHVAQCLVEGRVCKECNNGWMSSLEHHVRSLLIDLMSGQRTLHALSAEERLLLARWTVKTAFVLSNAAPLDAVVPEDHPRALKEITDTLSTGVGVFANQHEPTGKFSYVQKNHWLRFSEEEQPEHPQRYKIALQLQNLILLVAHWPPPTRLVLASATHIPIWPVETLSPSYYPGIDLPRPYDSRSLLMRFSDTLAVLHPM